MTLALQYDHEQMVRDACQNVHRCLAVEDRAAEQFDAMLRPPVYALVGTIKAQEHALVLAEDRTCDAARQLFDVLHSTPTRHLR